MNKISVIGLDLAKNVFQVSGPGSETAKYKHDLSQGAGEVRFGRVSRHSLVAYISIK